MEFYGITGRAYDLIKSYLQQRCQWVLINLDWKKYYSEWELPTDGVGPLLFLLYVNDLPNAISDRANLVLYANDTSLIITNSITQMFEKDTANK
jgi:hypothetical protein